MGIPVAVVGCGLAGVDMPYSHLKGYVQHPRTTVALLIDTDVKKAVQARDDYSIMCPVAYDKWHALRMVQPVIVSICTPENSHVMVMRKVLRFWTPAAFFVEKPLATTLVGCEAIMEMCDEKNVLLAVNHSRAWDSDVRRMGRPSVIEFGGKPWRNDVHAMHLGLMLGDRFNVRKREENGLWADGKMLWGDTRENVMQKAISDILLGIETGKEPECNGDDGANAVAATIRWREAVSR